ncbi:MAG: cobalamin-dependent protein [Syntrophales bacterium]
MVESVLKDVGMEVIFTRYQIVDDVVKTALEEDVDAIALSYYSSGVMYEAPKVMQWLKERNMEDVLVVIGGTPNAAEKSTFLEMGVGAVFTPGVGTVQDVADCIIAKVRQR